MVMREADLDVVMQPLATAQHQKDKIFSTGGRAQLSPLADDAAAFKAR